MDKNISIVIQSRLGSSRIPGKMLKDFAGTTLVDILLTKLLQSKESNQEGAISVYESNNYFWNPEGKMHNKWPDGFTSMNTKYVESTKVAAHCMYGSRVDLLKKGEWVTDKIPYEVELITMPELEAFDIDDQWQFEVAETLYEKQ
jgi:CMP-N-acetylneuraminic acid synthetase